MNDDDLFFYWNLQKGKKKINRKNKHNILTKKKISPQIVILVEAVG